MQSEWARTQAATGGNSDAEAAEDQTEPWFIFQAKNIAKISHTLQTKLMGKELLQYYAEWCNVPIGQSNFV